MLRTPIIAKPSGLARERVRQRKREILTDHVTTEEISYIDARPRALTDREK